MYPGSVETSALAERWLSAYGHQVVKILMAFRLSVALLDQILRFFFLVFKVVAGVLD
jgi:hypothetical protein